MTNPLNVNSLPVFLAKRSASLGSLIRTTTHGLNLLSAEPSCFRSCVRTLGNGPTLALDADPGPTLRPSVDESTCSVLFPINTPSKDRMGDIVLPKGCLPLLQRNYGRNPRIFFSHHQKDLPIASARDPEGRLAVEVQDDVIWSRAYFHMETPESRMIFALVARKELEAASIGFLPIKASIMEVSKDAERPETDEYGEDLIYFQDGHPWYPSLRFHEWDLTEWSIVPIPANADCISMHLSRGVIDGEPVTQSLRKSLEPYSLPRKIWSPGAVLEQAEEKGVEESVTPGLSQHSSPLSLSTLESPTMPQVTEPVVGSLPPGVDFTEPTPVPEPAMVEVVKDGSMDPLIALPGTKPTIPALNAPTPASKEEPVTEPVMPLGAKFLRSCMGDMQTHRSMCELACKELDHPKVKKYAEKRMTHMDMQHTKCKALANKLYPEHFDAPESKALEALAEYQKSLVRVEVQVEKEVPTFVPVLTPTESIDWSALKTELDAIAAGQDRLSETYFELTGIHV